MAQLQKLKPVQTSGLLICAFVGAGLLLMLCATMSGWGDKGLDTKCDYVAIALKETHKAYPEYDTNQKTAINDRGRVVTVYFPPPEPRPGGSPRIDIEKGTCRVTSVVHDQ